MHQILVFWERSTYASTSTTTPPPPPFTGDHLCRVNLR